jgi:hypothetical protein
MPEMGHSRDFDRAAITSDLPPNDKHFLSPSARPKGTNTGSRAILLDHLVGAAE